MESRAGDNPCNYVSLGAPLHERTPNGASSTMPLRPANWLLALFSAAAVAGFVLVHQRALHDWQIDLHLYAYALDVWRAGLDPYRAEFLAMYYLYPPVFLYLEGFLANLLPGPWGRISFTALHLSATCALPLVLAHFYFRKPWLTPWFALLLFFASPRFTGMLVLCEMNIATILYFLGFVAAAPGIRRNRWEWFYVAVFLAAMVKFTFLAMLLLPLLAGRRQWIQSVICGAAVAAANLGQMVLWPQLYQEYRWAMTRGILDQQAFGFGVFGVMASYNSKHSGGVGRAPFVISGILAVLLAVSMFVLWRKLRSAYGSAIDLAGDGNWLALVVITIILVNPRLMQYDVDIALLAAYVLLVYGLRAKRLLLLYILLFLPSLLVPLVILNPHLHGVYESLIAFVAFGIGYWRLWREADGENPELLRPAATTA